MRGVWLEGGALRVRGDLPVLEPAAGEALLRVLCAGICGTDLELPKGYAPFTGVPGHEFVGVVEAASGRPEWLGRRVVGEINVACHRCASCRAGRPRHCEDREVVGIRGRGGAFAEYLTLPAENLHAVPEGVADEVAVFTEPTAAALEIQEQVRISPGDRVVVIGAGRLGQLVARTLALTGCDLRVVGRHPEAIRLLAEAGIRAVPLAELAERAADVVVECTGNPEGLALARRAVRARGTIVLKSTYAGTAALDLSSVVVDEVTLVGSRCGPFAPALDALALGRVDVRPLIQARYALDDAVAAFEHAARPGVLKVLLLPG